MCISRKPVKYYEPSGSLLENVFDNTESGLQGEMRGINALDIAESGLKSKMRGRITFD